MNPYTCPAVSAIVVNYNAGAFLGLCIERIRKSTPAVELIVVDNHSRDISKIWALGCNGRQNEKYIQNDRNLGFSAAVNIGASVASGDILVVINPDCLVWPHTIDRLCRLLKDQQEVGLVGGLVFGIHGREQAGCRRHDVTLIRTIGKMLGKFFPLRNMPTIDMTNEPMPQDSIDVDAVSGSFFAIRKSLYNELGGMDEDYFLHFEDLDLCRRVREAGSKVVFNPGVSAVHVGAVSSGVNSVEIARHKHHSLMTYFRKHSNRHSFAAYAISLMSQSHLKVKSLADLAKPEASCGKDPGQFEGSWPETNGNGVLVIGAQSRLVRSVVMRLAARGYVVFVETTDPQTAPRIPRVTWITSEYTAKVPDRDWPEFSCIICLGSADRLTTYQQRFAHRAFSLQLLLETRVEAKAVEQNSTDEKPPVSETTAGWLERGPFVLQSWLNHVSHKNYTNLHNNNMLDSISDSNSQHQFLIDGHQRVHVDDISELCLDALVGINEQVAEASTHHILKDCLGRFSRRIRPLYN